MVEGVQASSVWVRARSARCQRGKPAQPPQLPDAPAPPPHLDRDLQAALLAREEVGLAALDALDVDLQLGAAKLGFGKSAVTVLGHWRALQQSTRRHPAPSPPPPLTSEFTSMACPLIFCSGSVMDVTPSIVTWGRGG